MGFKINDIVNIGTTEFLLPTLCIFQEICSVTLRELQGLTRRFIKRKHVQHIFKTSNPSRITLLKNNTTLILLKSIEVRPILVK
mgnify:CR=1 FL=1